MPLQLQTAQQTKQNNSYSLLNEIQGTPSNQSRLVLLNSDAEQLITERAIGRIVRETY